MLIDWRGSHGIPVLALLGDWEMLRLPSRCCRSVRMILREGHVRPQAPYSEQPRRRLLASRRIFRYS